MAEKHRIRNMFLPVTTWLPAGHVLFTVLSTAYTGNAKSVRKKIIVCTFMLRPSTRTTTVYCTRRIRSIALETLGVSNYFFAPLPGLAPRSCRHSTVYTCTRVPENSR